MRPLGVLIFISLILSTLQEGSPEVTSFELLTAGVLGVTFFWGTIEFLSSRRGIPRPLFYLLGFLVWAGVNVVIALGNDVKLLWWFRRFFPVLTLPLTALASTVAFRSQRQIRVALRNVNSHWANSCSSRPPPNPFRGPSNNQQPPSLAEIWWWLLQRLWILFDRSILVSSSAA